MLLTKRETRLVLPTANPPSMQTFFCIMMSGRPLVAAGRDAHDHAAIFFFPGFVVARDRRLPAADARRGDSQMTHPIGGNRGAERRGTRLAERDVGLVGAVRVGVTDERDADRLPA